MHPTELDEFLVGIISSTLPQIEYLQLTMKFKLTYYTVKLNWQRHVHSLRDCESVLSFVKCGVELSDQGNTP